MQNFQVLPVTTFQNKMFSHLSTVFSHVYYARLPNPFGRNVALGTIEIIHRAHVISDCIILSLLIS